MKAKGERQKAKIKSAFRVLCARASSLRRPFALCLLPFAFCLLAASARAQYAQPPVGPVPTGNSAEVLKKVGIEQKLNSQIPLDATFRDESGREEIGRAHV